MKTWPERPGACPEGTLLLGMLKLMTFARNPQITRDVIKYNKGTHEIINAHLLRTMQRILYR